MIGVAFVVLVFGALISVIYGKQEGQDFVNGCANLFLAFAILIAGAIAYAYGYGLIVGLIVGGIAFLTVAWHIGSFLVNEASLKKDADKRISQIGLCILGVSVVVLYGLWRIGVNSLKPSLSDLATQTYSPVDSPTSGGYTSYGNKTFGINTEIANPTTCANYGITYTGSSLWVQSVVSGSPAQLAQLPTGVIVEVDGYAPDSQVLTAVKARHNVGDWISFKIVTPDRRWWNYWIQLGS